MLMCFRKRELEDMEELAKSGQAELLPKIAAYHEQRRKWPAALVGLL